MATEKTPRKKVTRSGGKVPSMHRSNGLEAIRSGLFSWLESRQTKRAKSPKAQVFFFERSTSNKVIESRLKADLPTWQLAQLREGKDALKLAGKEGPIWVLRPDYDEDAISSLELKSGAFSASRDLMGRVAAEFEQAAQDLVAIEFVTDNADEKLGALVGIDLASYSYKRSLDEKKQFQTRLLILGVSDELITEAVNMARAQNMARHLVNTPPNELNPVTYAELIQNLFNKLPNVKVDIWDEKKLAKESMNLMLAVGKASETQPRLVRITYRPKSAAKKSPIAFVGKGITFDSGGLDIKPPAGMRLMKKDMGGSAALVGWFHWLVTSGSDLPVDVYLSLAENAISANAFRPGDIYTGRNGKSVEIHNTDAEGRLVLADALSLAVEGENGKKPEKVVCLATLTGAAKIGLGADIAAYYSNQDELISQVATASRKSGDYAWNMPLFEGYVNLLKSNVADINHCASSPFGGSITAALYLKDYVQNLPFLHFDIFAWNDRPRGALREQGGSGQAVALLIELVKLWS